MSTTTLTASQLEWQSQYEALRAQQVAYKAQEDALTINIDPNQLTPDQTNRLNVAKYKQVEVETELLNLQTNIHQALTSRLTSVGTAIAGTQSTDDPAYAQLLAYQDTVLQARTELDAVAQNWAIPDPGSTVWEINSVRYSTGNPPQSLGWAYAWDALKNHAVGAFNGAVNIIDSAGAVKTDISNWINSIPPSLKYQVCKNNWDRAGSAMKDTLTAPLAIPNTLVGKIATSAIGNANDYAFSIGASVCKSMQPKADLLSFLQSELGTIPDDVQYALDSWESNVVFDIPLDLAAQLAAEGAAASAVNQLLSINTAAPATLCLAEAGQAWSNTMTDWSIDPAAACNASLANSASSQAKLEQAILGDAITSIASNLNATPTTDYLANLVNSFRIGLGEEDAAIVNATEIRTLTGAQGGGEVWGGGRLLELSDGGLNEWYVFNESVYAYNVANGITSTAPSAPGNTSYNGTLGTAPYAQPGADNYDGLGILYNFNLGSNTTFLTYGSGGSTDYVCPADTTTNIWNENFSITNSPVNNLGYYGTFTGSKGSASRLIFQNHATSPTH